MSEAFPKLTFLSRDRLLSLSCRAFFLSESKSFVDRSEAEVSSVRLDVDVRRDNLEDALLSFVDGTEDDTLDL